MPKNENTNNSDLVYLGKPGGKVSGPYTQDDIAELKQSGEYAEFSWMWDPETGTWMAINLPPAPAAGPNQDEFPFAAKAATEVDPATLYEFSATEVEAQQAEELVIEKSPEAPAKIAAEKAKNAEAAAPTTPGIPSKPTIPPKPTKIAVSPAGKAPVPPAGKAAASVPRPPIRQANSFSLAAGAKQVSLPLLAVCHDNRSAVSGTVSWISPRGFVLVADHDPSQLPPFHRGGKVWLNLLDDATGKSENVRVTISDFHRRSGHWEFQMAWDAVPSLLANAMPSNS